MSSFSQAQGGPAVENKKDELDEETLDPNVSGSLLHFYFFNNFYVAVCTFQVFFFLFNEIIQLRSAQERTFFVIFFSATAGRSFIIFIVNFTFTISMGVASALSFLGIFEQTTFEYFDCLALQLSVLFLSHMIITRHSEKTVFVFVL